MLITLYGPDSYRRKKKLYELVFFYKLKNKGIDAMFFDLEENPDFWEDVLNFLEQPSMFANSKLAVVEGVEQIERKDWINALKSYKDSRSVFIIISERKKPTQKFNFLLAKPAQFQVFEELTGKELSRFLTKKTKELKIQLSLEAKKFFLAYLLSSKEDRSWRAVNELEKVSSAKFGRVVEEDDLKKTVEWRNSEKMFSITGKILNLQNERAKLSFLEELISRGEDPGHIFNLLGCQARGKNAEKLAEYDILVKSGKLEYEEALAYFVLAP